MFDVASLPIIILAIILAGIFCIVIADSVSELANRFPSAPGVRTYFKKAYSEKYSLFLVYIYVVFVIIAGAVESSLFAHIFHQLFPGVNSFLILTLMLLFTVMSNLYGYVLPRLLEVLTTIIVLVILIFLGFYGMSYGGVQGTGSSFAYLVPKDLYGSLPLAVGLGIFLFVGFEWVAPLGFSRQSYKRKIPISMPIGIIVNIFVYIIFCVGLANLIPHETIAKEILPQLKLANGVLPFFGKFVIIVLAASCTVSTFNAGMLGGSKLIYALARERKFPPYLVKVSMRTGQPYVAIIFIGISVGILAVLTHILKMELLLATCATSIITLIYASILFASNRLRGRESSLTKEHYVPMFSKYPKIVLGVILLLIGLSVVFSIPGSELETFLVLMLCVSIAWCCTWVYSKDKD